MRPVTIGTGGRARRILLPGGAVRDLQRDVISTCLVVVDASGKTCGQKFYRGQEALATKHTLDCLNRHRDELEAHMNHIHPEIMKPWDPEFAAWMHQHREAVAEGRMKV
jgi:hypothetical protein